jgi:exopolysaccharide biosynthesis polyprenyl glycosylphosphotransferase
MNWVEHDAPRGRWLGFALWAGDIACAVLAMALAAVVRRILPFGVIPDREYVTPGVLVLTALVWGVVFYFLGAYERRNRDEWRDEVRAVLLASVFAVCALAASFYFFKVELFSRALFVYFFVLDVVFTLAWRASLRAWRTRRGARTVETRRAVIVGTDAAAQELAAHVRMWEGYTLLGFVTDRDAGELESTTLDAPVLGNLSDAARLVTRLDIDDVFLTQSVRGRAELAELILALREQHVRVRLMPDLLEVVTVRTGIETLRGLPMITLREPAITGINGVLKRALDVVGAAVCLVVFAPVMLVIAIWIRLDSPGPVLFTQERAGQYGKPFRIYKFRTMVANAEALLDQVVNVDELSEPHFKLRNDPRVTRVGKWLRRTSLDELPQFFNVLWGNMSLVGPRPEMMRLASQYSPLQRQRLLVKPGLTGAMQIGGRGDLSFEEWMKLELDYIENYSIWRDLVILAKTVPAVLSGRGAY